MIPNVRTFIDVNSKLCLVVGGFLNILLSWLVCTRTPKEMRSYSIIILQTCFCDLANLVIGDFFQPVLFIYDGMAVVISNGLAGQLPYPWNVFGYYVWIFFAFFAIISIIVQFFYRYLILCQNQRVSNLRYFLMLAAVAVILAVYFAWLISLSFPPADAVVNDVYVSQLMGHNSTLVNVNAVDNNSVQVSAVAALTSGHGISDFIPPELRMALKGKAGQTFWIIWHVGFITTAVVTYACIAYFGREMVMYTKKNRQDSIRSNAAELNRQLTLNLIFQATIPLAALIGWVICAYACIFGAVFAGGWFNIFTSLVATPTQNWTSVLNPLVTICTIKSYRRSLMRLVKRRGAIGPRTSGYAGYTNSPNSQNQQQQGGGNGNSRSQQYLSNANNNSTKY